MKLKYSENIAIVSTPFQLLNLREYLEKNPLEEIYIIALYFFERDKIQTIEVARFTKLKINKYIKRYKRGITYFSLLPLLLNRNKTHTFIFGHLLDRQMLFASKLLNAKKAILIDDGMATLSTYKFYKGKKDPNKKYFSSFLSFLDLTYPKELTFFSLFLLSNPKKNIYKNDFSFLNSYLSNKPIGNITFFIGQPLLHYISKGQYNQYLICVQKKSPNSTLMYLPHRYEKESDIESYKELGFKIIRPKINFECFLVSLEILPERIVGICSTSLFTTEILIKKNKLPICIESLLLPQKTQKDNLAIEETYTYMRKHSNIKISEIC